MQTGQRLRFASLFFSQFAGKPEGVLRSRAAKRAGEARGGGIACFRFALPLSFPRA